MFIKGGCGFIVSGVGGWRGSGAFGHRLAGRVYYNHTKLLTKPERSSHSQRPLAGTDKDIPDTITIRHHSVQFDAGERRHDRRAWGGDSNARKS